MKIVSKDITTVSEGIICHACNCQNKFGKGLAKSIRDKYPIVYNEFLKFGNSIKNPRDRLGKNQLVRIDDSLHVCNMFTQLYYGNSKDTGIDYNDYGAIETCLNGLVNIRNSDQVYFPYYFGSGLAGGDWNRISNMIIEKIPDVIFCKFGG